MNRRRRRRPPRYRRRAGWLRHARRSTPFLLALLLLLGWSIFSNQQTEAVSATQFALCTRPPHHDCVIDGDTFYLRRTSIRIADIDTPETFSPRCASEAALGGHATRRLRQLLNAGPFTLVAGARDEDRYGRKLRTVMRDGRSIGQQLVREDLARPWTGRRQPWCDA